MAEPITRKEIAARIFRKLWDLLKPQLSYNLDDETSWRDINLSRDLFITDQLKEALSLPYSKISTSYEGGIPVSIDDADKVKTMADLVDLLYDRARGKR